MAHMVELRQLKGQFFDTQAGKLRTVAWEMDQLLLNGRQIATINRVPGAPIGVLDGVRLSASEAEAVMAAVAKERDGIRPKRISYPVSLPFTIVDDEDEVTVNGEPGEPAEGDVVDDE